MRRIAGFGGDRFSAVFVHKPPADFPKAVPLPKGALLGSTAVAGERGSAGDDTLYYNMTRSQLHAYQGRLRTSGWTAAPSFVRPYGFIVFGGNHRIADECRAARIRGQHDGLLEISTRRYAESGI